MNCWTPLYNKEGFEKYQFAWAASFGSVLLDISEEQDLGLVLGLHSEDSSTGKTSVCKAAISNFANPGGHGIKAGGRGSTTPLAMTLMAGLQRNTPVLMDEVTGMTPDELGDVIYRFADGTGKYQGDARGGLRDTSCFNWKSIVYVTANDPLVERISANNRHNTEGQIYPHPRRGLR